MLLLLMIIVAITLKHEIPGQIRVIPGSLDKHLKSVKSLDCPGQPWTVGNYVHPLLTLHQDEYHTPSPSSMHVLNNGHYEGQGFHPLFPAVGP